MREPPVPAAERPLTGVRSVLTEDPAFLAARLRIIALVGVTVLILGTLALAARAALSGRADTLTHPGFVGIVFGGCALFTLVFVRPLTRGSVRAMRRFETIVSVVLTASFAPFTHLPEGLLRAEMLARFGAHPGYDLLIRQYGALAAVFSAGVILLLRSALVPSSALRTTLIHGALTVPLLGISAYGWLPWGAAIPLPLTDRLGVVAATATWWLRVSIACVVVSHVVYRLRGEVHEYRALGQYVLGGKIGHGGMGSVYRAHHALLKRPMAVKLLDGLRPDDLAVARFGREAQLTATLSHPNTIHVYDFGQTPEGTFFYVMELLDGLDLGDLVASHGPQPPGRVIHILECVCRSLYEAHCRGLVHRDIKPANVFLCREYGGMADFVKVLDFGLVREAGIVATDVTEHGTIAGTPMYMAPEVLRNSSAATARSDLYAVGALAYTLLTGHELYSHRTLADVVAAQLHQLPLPPSTRIGRPLPEGLEALVMGCLEKDPANRPSSADRVAEQLAQLAVSCPWTREERAHWWAHEAPPPTVPSVNPTGPTVIVARERAPRSRRST
jgi:uncharacterized membrane protein